MSAAFYNTNYGAFGPQVMLRVQNNTGEEVFVGAFEFLARVRPIQYVAPLTGASVQISDQVGILILEPAGTIATLTMILPVNPFDGQRIEFTSTATVTALTIAASGSASLAGTTPTTIGGAISTHFFYVYRATNTTWYVA